MRGSKCVPLWLDRETYQRLEQVAEAEVRSPEQQVRWLLRQALSVDDAAEPAARELVSVGGGPDAAA